MTPSQRLHNFARRYCMDRHAHWVREYEHLSRRGSDRIGPEYSPEAFATYPRYNVLHAILLGVEAVDFEELPGVEELRALLSLAGRTAETPFTKNPGNSIASSAQEEERTLFVEAVQTANTDNPVESLPYRRVLRTNEVAALRDRLANTWGVSNGYWYPLGRKTHPSLVAFEIDKIDEAELQERIRDFLRKRAVNRIFELREHGTENYCLQAGAWDLYYDGAEGHWISETNDWIVYCSHERTITLGGSIVEIAPNRGRL